MGARAAMRLPVALASARRAAGQEPRAVLAIIGIATGSTVVVLGLTASTLSGVVTGHPLELLEFCLVAVALAWTPVQIYGRGSFTFAGAGLLAASFELGVGAGMVAA